MKIIFAASESDCATCVLSQRSLHPHPHHPGNDTNVAEMTEMTTVESELSSTSNTTKSDHPILGFG